jgi:hypothetical protein
MPGESVAVEGEVVATPGDIAFTGAEKGEWIAGPVIVQSYGNLTVGSKKVIYQAQCTFDFTGQSSSGAVVKGVEMVTLKAGQTRLQNNETGVLVKGDEKTGQFGNKLAVETANVLHTAQVSIPISG